MKKKLIALGAGLALFLMGGMAHAAMITIGTATYLGSECNLIWDDNNNGNSVIWLDYSRFPTSWENRVTWASNLNVSGVLTYNIDSAYTVDWGASSWRLPTTVDGLYELGWNGTTTAGYNITTSEMGHLFYEELGNLGHLDTSGNYPAEYGLKNTGDFDNLFAGWYGSGTVYEADSTFAWYFNMNDGSQERFKKNFTSYGLALRNGQVSVTDPVPEPATMLLFSIGLLGLAVCGRKKRISG